MAQLDLRVRVLGRLLRRANSISRMDDEQIRKAQQTVIGHNPVLDLVLGGVASGVRITEDTAAGETGPLTIRVYRPEGSAARCPWS